MYLVTDKIYIMTFFFFLEHIFLLRLASGHRRDTYGFGKILSSSKQQNDQSTQCSEILPPPLLRSKR